MAFASLSRGYGLAADEGMMWERLEDDLDCVREQLHDMRAETAFDGRKACEGLNAAISEVMRPLDDCIQCTSQ